MDYPLSWLLPLQKPCECSPSLLLTSSCFLSFIGSLPLFHSELSKYVMSLQVQHKTSAEPDITAHVIGALFRLTRRRQQWRYSLTLVGSW